MKVLRVCVVKMSNLLKAKPDVNLLVTHSKPILMERVHQLLVALAMKVLYVTQKTENASRFPNVQVN
jgi:hypothetical protein